MSDPQPPVEQDTEPRPTDQPERDELLAIRRDVDVADLMMFLRIKLGFWPERQVPGEQAALEGQPPFPPTGSMTIDCGRWMAWARIGLPLFSNGSLPPMRLVVSESKRMVLALAKEAHGGNITKIAETLGMSRRSIRESLKAAGLYDKSDDAGADPDDGLD